MEKTNVQLRVLCPEDAEAFFNLRALGLQLNSPAFGQDHSEWVSTPMSDVVKRIETREDGSCVIGAFAPDLIGCVGINRNRSVKGKHKAEIWGMLVHPDFRGFGIGKMLLQEAIDHARAHGIEDLMLGASSKDAERLYASVGFKAFGIEPRALKIDGEYLDEAQMQLRL